MLKQKLTEEKIRDAWNMVYNLSLRMLRNEEEAKDATQSIFALAAGKLPTFRNEAKFTTWLYRIAYNYLIDVLRKPREETITFELFEKDVTHFREYGNELNLTREEEAIYCEEIKVGCTKAMLQCLETEERFAFVLGSLFAFPGKEAAKICGVSPEAYRKRLSRSKSKIRNFMSKNCGLVNPDAKCRCRKRLLIAKERGRINMEKSLHRTESPQIRDFVREMNEMDDISRIYRNNPFREIDGDEIARQIARLGVMREKPVSLT